MSPVLASPQMSFQPALRIGGRGAAPGQFHEALRGIAIGPDDRLYAAGDSAVRVYDGEGALEREWPTRRPGNCIALDGSGRVWVGEMTQVEIFGPDGALADTWRDPGRLGLVTAIGFHADDVFLADATTRWIRRYDREGRFRNAIGDRHRKGGFHIPNGVVDFTVDGEGVLHVANPGMHRVERWTADGEPLGHFGHFDGRDPAGFGGCCNPTNLALDAAGRVVVTEKAGPRAKVYSPEGALLAVVADDVFDPRAKNMDLAVDSHGRIYVADTAALEVRVFQPASEARS